MIVNTLEQFKLFLKQAERETFMAVDTETTGLRPFHGDWIIGASFLFESDLSTYYIPVRHEYPNPDVNLSPDLLFSRLSVLFSNPELTIVMHNAKYDLKFFEKEGVYFKGKALDTQILAHLHNENERELGGGYRLKEDLGKKYLSADADEEKIALSECANEWKADQIEPLQQRIEELETTMTLIERDWKNEQKEEFKLKLEDLRSQVRARMKEMGIKLEKKTEEEEGEGIAERALKVKFDRQLFHLSREIADYKGKVTDINKRNPIEHKEDLPEYVPLYEKRKELMNQIQEIKDIDYMSKLAHYPLGIVAKYAEQDVKLTFGLYQWFRYGEKVYGNQI